MTVSQLPYKNYLFRTLKWFIANAIFGLAPLLFMLGISMLSNGKAGQNEVVHLIKDGAVLFVCCAMMGSVVVDFKLAGFEFQGLRFFAIYISPFAILVYLLMDYILIYFKVVKNDYFDLTSRTSLITIGLATIYCIFAKTNLYMKEDSKHAKHN